MRSYIMYDILKLCVLENLAKREAFTSFLGGGSDGLDPALIPKQYNFVIIWV